MLSKTDVVPALLKERAYDELKRRILNEAYPPGTFLAERRLAEELGMSKTPVKAALERLELEGFVVVSPQQGIVVREFSVHEIADLYEIRTALESFTLRCIAGRLKAAEIKQLEQNLAAFRETSRTGDIVSAVALDAEFHFLFARILNNHEILRVMENLRQKMHRTITRVFHLSPGRIDASHAEHRAVVDLLIAGDRKGAADLIEQHLQKGKHLILERGPAFS
jgi:DNA-binding GntR family transcriptional regulator